VLALLAALLTACNPAPRSAADRLQPCAIEDGPAGAYCGHLEVPENRAEPGGRKIKLKIVLLRALRRDPRPDPLFLLAGGPGQGAAKLAKPFGRTFRRFQNDRDIVLVDQRGTGDSNPLDCKGPENESDNLSNIGDPGNERFRDCLKKYDADPRFYTTSIAMDDLDAVRAHLGYEQINVWGGSYGTRAALVYLRRHPQNVRTVTLDGVAPPDMKLPLYFARDGQRALDLLIAACEKDSACSASFPAFRKKIAALLDRLESRPRVAVTHPRIGERQEFTLSRDVASFIIMEALYIPSLSALVPRLVEDAAAGNYEGLLAMAFAGEQTGESISIGMQLSVMCSEDVPRITDKEIAAVTDGTFLGRMMFETRMKPCEFWPRAAIEPEFYQPVTSGKPVLILSGELDPVTPPSWGEHIQPHLSNSRHIIVPGLAHGVSTAGCVPELISRFLDTASAMDLDAACVQNLKRPPFFVNYSGPQVHDRN
jgi:pimeloyl-ACP methyl ester carboxylesterase